MVFKRETKEEDRKFLTKETAIPAHFAIWVNLTLIQTLAAGTVSITINQLMSIWFEIFNYPLKPGHWLEETTDLELKPSALNKQVNSLLIAIQCSWFKWDTICEYYKYSWYISISFMIPLAREISSSWQYIDWMGIFWWLLILKFIT